MQNPDNEAAQFLRSWEAEARDKHAKEIEAPPPDREDQSGNAGEMSFADVLKDEQEG